MTLILTIENETSLPNGAPVSVKITDKRNLDIGRGAHLDWTLPDPSRFISGKHCEVRYRDEAYWLYDVSTNGTFLNDNSRRIQTPHRLCDGDRLAIGSYIIAVTIEDDTQKPDIEAAGVEAEAEEVAEASFAAEPALAGTGEFPPEAHVADGQVPIDKGQVDQVPDDQVPNGQVANSDLADRDAAGREPADAQTAPAAEAEEPVHAGAEPEPEPVLTQEYDFPAEPMPVSDWQDMAKAEAEVAAFAFDTVNEDPAHEAAGEALSEPDAPRPRDEVKPAAAFEPEAPLISMPRISETPAYFSEPAREPIHEPVPEPVHEPSREPFREPISESIAPLREPAQEPLAAESAAPRMPKAAPPEIPARAETGGVKSDVTLDDFLQQFAAAAGIPAQIFERQDKLKTAEDLGFLIHFVVASLKQLLSARDSAKRFARTSNRTVVQAFDNNPLKFAPTPEDALKIMFGPKTSGYLDARRTLEGAFGDLKTHQVKTFSAMQNAVKMLVEDLDPEEIDTAMGPDQGLLSMLSSRKARLWDLYLARWQAKTLRHDDGLVDAFMLYFAECYDGAKD